MLADRLRRLVDAGIFERVLYAERPARYEYVLTERGRDLFTALNALRQWGDEHLTDKPMRLRRRKADGRPVIAALVPTGTSALLEDEMELVPGPGFPAVPAQPDAGSASPPRRLRTALAASTAAAGSAARTATSPSSAGPSDAVPKGSRRAGT